MSERIKHRTMSLDDAQNIWRMMRSETTEYTENFAPFCSHSQFALSIANAKKDIYACVTFDQELAGFFMLRGLDAGYTRPSFGIYVASNAANQGIASYALHQSIGMCRDRKIAKIFLKVAESNAVAMRLYERFGFVAIGICPDTGHVTMEREDRE